MNITKARTKKAEQSQLSTPSISPAPAASSSIQSPLKENMDEKIRQKAYELYLNRGASHGQDFNDWLEAERLVLAEQKKR